MKSLFYPFLIVGIIMGVVIVSTSDGGSGLRASIPESPNKPVTQSTRNETVTMSIQEISEYEKLAQDYRDRASVEVDPKKRELYKTRAQRYEDAFIKARYGSR